MENNKNKKSVKFQGDMLNFCDFIQVFIFTRNHHLKNSPKFGRPFHCGGIRKPCCCVPIVLTTFPHEPQRNISIAAVRGAVRPSKNQKATDVVSFIEWRKIIKSLDINYIEI